jgi:hypothetical protein
MGHLGIVIASHCCFSRVFHTFVLSYPPPCSGLSSLQLFSPNTFLILRIAIIWCHSFTKLTGVRGKCTTGSFSKLFTLLCTFLFTLLFIIYPLHAASVDLANDFINNLFNSSGGGSIGGDPWYY